RATRESPVARGWACNSMQGRGQDCQSECGVRSAECGDGNEFGDGVGRVHRAPPSALVPISALRTSYSALYRMMCPNLVQRMSVMNGNGRSLICPLHCWSSSPGPGTYE